MATEDELLALGPAAVIAAVGRADSDLDLRPLGQACFWQACGSDALDAALPWADAAICCYRAAADEVSGPFTREGAESVLYGIMFQMVRAHGAADPRLAAYLRAIQIWFAAPSQRFADVRAFHAALHADAAVDHEAAVLLRMRLVLACDWDPAVCAPGLAAWFVAAGIHRPDATSV